MMPMSLTFTEQAEKEILDVKDICGSLTESFVNDKIDEMTENKVTITNQSTIINHVGSVSIEEARECAQKFKKKQIPQ